MTSENIIPYYLKRQGVRVIFLLSCFRTNVPYTEKIRKEVYSVFGKDKALSEAVSIYFSHRYGGETLKGIGTHFGIGESAVSQRNRRLALKLEKDNKLRKKIKGIESRLKLSRV